MSKESIVSEELFRTLNGRLQDSDAKHRDAAYEVNVLASIKKTLDALIELGATDAEIAGVNRFRERFAKKLIKKHKIGGDELIPAKKEEE